MFDASLRSVTAEIETLLERKIGAKGRNLHEKLRHAGRRLPRRIRRELAYLAEAEARYENPKRAGQYEADRVTRAYQQTVDYLERIDPGLNARIAVMRWMAGNLVNIALVAAATIWAATAFGLI